MFKTWLVSHTLWGNTRQIHGMIVITTARIAIARTNRDLSSCVQQPPFSWEWEGETVYSLSAKVWAMFPSKQSQSMKHWSWGTYLLISWFWPPWVWVKLDSITADCLWLSLIAGGGACKEEKNDGQCGRGTIKSTAGREPKRLAPSYQSWHFRLHGPTSLTPTWIGNNHITHMLPKRQSFLSVILSASLRTHRTLRVVRVIPELSSLAAEYYSTVNIGK